MSVDPASDLRGRVKAAVREYDTVVQFHESWRIAAHDKALHGRVSHSFAGQTFLIVRRALRREMLLGLSRLWDHRTEAIKIISIADDLENPTILDSLLPNTPIYAEARGQAAQAAALIRRYEKGGSSHSTLSRLRKLRNQHLAHHQITAKLARRRWGRSARRTLPRGGQIGPPGSDRVQRVNICGGRYRKTAFSGGPNVFACLGAPAIREPDHDPGRRRRGQHGMKCA